MTWWQVLVLPTVVCSLSSLGAVPRRAFLATTGAITVSYGVGQPCEAATPRYLDEYVELGGSRTLVRRFTGEATPFRFKKVDISDALDPESEWPAKWPFTKNDFGRLDEVDDGSFYDAPRLVYHIDEGAVSALTHFYAEAIPDGSDLLDICSSWVSHYPVDFPARMHSIVGTGMNALELGVNKQLGSFVPRDLNKTPTLPFKDQSFDVVTCVVSVDYLTNPLEILREINRVLRPGGKVIFSQSNRFFFTKAVAIWTSSEFGDDRGHLNLISGYLQYAGGFDRPRAYDISAKGDNARDPMFIIEAARSGGRG